MELPPALEGLPRFGSSPRQGFSRGEPQPRSRTFPGITSLRAHPWRQGRLDRQRPALGVRRGRGGGGHPGARNPARGAGSEHGVLWRAGHRGGLVPYPPSVRVLRPRVSGFRHRAGLPRDWTARLAGRDGRIRQGLTGGDSSRRAVGFYEHLSCRDAALLSTPARHIIGHPGLERRRSVPAAGANGRTT